jgi:hypothetical protein
MSIVFDENLDLFCLETANTSYIIGLADHRTFVGHVYYGRRVRGQDLRYLLRTGEAPFVPSENERERCSFYDTFPSEYSGNGVGDYRESSIAVRTQAGQHAVMPTYVSYEITDLYTKNCTAPINIAHKKADKVVILDFNGKDRVPEGYSDDISEYSPENIIGFDHHHTTEHKINGNLYIDTTAKSNCGVLTRFFESIGEKINKKDAKSLYCGMVSDYKKSGLVKLNKIKNKYELVKTDKLYADKNSLEVINKNLRKLSNKDTLFFKSTLDINISPPNIFLDSLLNKILWFNDSHFISSILPYWSGT